MLSVRKINFVFISVFLLWFVLPYGVQGQINLMSWNIKDFGKSRDDVEIEMIANVIKDADLVAIQEVVAIDPGGAKAVARLVSALNNKGASWDYIISDRTDSPSNHMSERYAFIWKKHKVKLVSEPQLISKLSHYIYREPYYGIFQLEGEKVHILNFHSRKYDDNPDIEVGYLYKLLSKNVKDNWILAGDFNLSEDHSVFNQFYNDGYESVISNQPTTLKRKCNDGNYLNHAIDNIYYKLSTLQVVEGGAIDFVSSCSRLGSIRNEISDHLPVFFELKSK